jgi:hypothetical protein
MLAVRNTQASADHGPKRLPKAKKIAAEAAPSIESAGPYR